MTSEVILNDLRPFKVKLVLFPFQVLALLQRAVLRVHVLEEGRHEVGETAPLRHRHLPHKTIHLCRAYREVKNYYRAGRPICRKVLKIMFWEVPPADRLIL